MIHFCSSTRQKCFRRYVVINVRWKNKMLDFQCSVICFVLPQFSPRPFLQILTTPLDKCLKCGNTIILLLILKPQYAIILTGSLSTQNEGNDDQWLIICRYWKWSNGGGPMQRQEGIPMMWDLSSAVTLWHCWRPLTNWDFQLLTLRKAIWRSESDTGHDFQILHSLQYVLWALGGPASCYSWPLYPSLPQGAKQTQSWLLYIASSVSHRFHSTRKHVYTYTKEILNSCCIQYVLSADRDTLHSTQNVLYFFIRFLL